MSPAPKRRYGWPVRRPMNYGVQVGDKVICPRFWPDHRTGWVVSGYVKGQDGSEWWRVMWFNSRTSAYDIEAHHTTDDLTVWFRRLASA